METDQRQVPVVPACIFDEVLQECQSYFSTPVYRRMFTQLCEQLVYDHMGYINEGAWVEGYWRAMNEEDSKSLIKNMEEIIDLETEVRRR